MRVNSFNVIHKGIQAVVAGGIAVAGATLAAGAIVYNNRSYEIPLMNVLTHSLSDAEVAKINKEKALPDGVKFAWDCDIDSSEDSMSRVECGWKITLDPFGIVTGTKQLPEGYELKQTCLGRTEVVPKGPTGFCIKG